MTWGYIAAAAITTAGALLSDKEKSSAAKKTRMTAARAREEELKLQKENRDISLALGAPYRQAANPALASMMDMLGLDRSPTGADNSGLPPGVGQDLSQYPEWQMETDPGYKFRVSEGTRSLDASASAKGQLFSGGAMRDAMTWGQDMASQEYMNIYNRLSNLAGLGAGTVGAGTQAASTASALGSRSIGDEAYTRASTYAAEANSKGDLYADLGKMIGGYDWGSVFNSSGATTGGGGGSGPTGRPGA